MKRIVICADGTWNTPDQEEFGRATPTNVVKLYHCIRDEDDHGTQQLTYYHPGVGTETTLSRLPGGALGEGLSRNVKGAYAFLSKHYEEGDEVYLFGFSRGAYTVRSLAGWLGRGLLVGGTFQNEPKAFWGAIDKAFTQYRARTDEPLGHPIFHQGKALPVHFLGVWDTVGALGIPDHLGLLNLLDQDHRWRFHDTKLGSHVAIARHAVALDERRLSFSPTLWTGYKAHQNVKQLWFAGTHSDVGGGLVGSELSDIALRWMLDEAGADGHEGGGGLAYHAHMVNQLRPDPSAPYRDSLMSIFKHLPTRPRGLPMMHSDSRDLHPSVVERVQRPPLTQGPYHPTRLMRPQESVEMPVYAHEPWNRTGLFLDPGRYRFEAAGEWLDDHIVCGPGGTKDGRFFIGELVHRIGDVVGVLEGAFKQISGNKAADFVGTRRHENIPWFALVGCVAREYRFDPDASEQHIAPCNEFKIGEDAEVDVVHSGYFYAFANDAWAFYGNNRGSVSLRVTRLN